MLVDLNDPNQKITETDALIMLIDAREHLDSCMKTPLVAVAYGTMELRQAEYRLRRDAAQKVGRVP